MNQNVTSDQIRKASDFSFFYRDRKYSRDFMNLWEATAKREAEAVSKVKDFWEWYHSVDVPCPFTKADLKGLADELMNIAELRCGEVLKHVRNDYLFITKITALSFFGGYTFSELIKLLDFTANMLD